MSDGPETADIDGEVSGPTLARALLVVPTSTGDILTRPRLIERFEDATQAPLAIVSGEPAAGKTSLVLDWYRSEHGRGRPLTWLTADSGLDDPDVFWKYLLASVERLDIHTDDLERALKDEGHPGEGWLTTFANRLSEVPGEPVVVIDDLHEITDHDTLESLRFLVERLSGSAHMAFLTRALPPWRMDQWRASCRLSEIDSSELRFTRDEVADFLRRTLGHNLEAEEIDILASRTEGWAGGLRLAVLSMSQTPDPGSFLADFAADDELISSFLFREVLDRQPEDVRSFLLDISVLSHFDAEICDAVRRSDDSAGLIGRCRAANLFVVDLDATGTRCRLHPLFAQLLRGRLDATDPDRAAKLHLIASEVRESRGEYVAAVDHAVAAGADALAGELIARNSGWLALRGHFDLIRHWLTALPRVSFTARPEVGLGMVSTLCLTDRPEEALRILDHLDEGDLSPEIRYTALQLRGFTHMFTGRVDRLSSIAEDLVERRHDSHPAVPYEPDRFASYLEGVAAYFAEDLVSARTAFSRSVHSETRPDLFYVEVPGWLALVAARQGRFDEAAERAREALRRSSRLDGVEIATVTEAHLSLGIAAWERDDLRTAESHLHAARRSVRPLLWLTVVVEMWLSRVHASGDRVARAREELTQATNTFWTGEVSSDLQAAVAEVQLDLALREADLDGARRWEREYRTHTSRRLPAASTLRLAELGDDPDVVALLGEPLPDDGPLPDRIDALLTSAEMWARRDDPDRCRDLVAEATHLAEPERFVRRFLDRDGPVWSAIDSLSDSPVPPGRPVASPRFIDVLLAARQGGAADVAARSDGSADELIEPLSEREVEVLGLLVDGLSYREMADRLFISRNTVKTHVRHVYTKLGVAGRDAAVGEARRLRLA